MRVRGILSFATDPIVVGMISGSHKGNFPIDNRLGSTTIKCFDELVIELKVRDGDGIIGDDGKARNGIISSETLGSGGTRSSVEYIGEIKEIGGNHTDVE